MRLNDNYYISKNNGDSFLVNIENGDVFLINDVVETALNLCDQYNSPHTLALAVFDRYKKTEGDYTLNELVVFIEELVRKKVVRDQ